MIVWKKKNIMKKSLMPNYNHVKLSQTENNKNNTSSKYWTIKTQPLQWSQ